MTFRTSVASILLATFSLAASFSIANDEYQKWLQEQKQGFESYLSKQDQELADLIGKEWQEYKLSFKEATYTRPKPETLPEQTLPEEDPDEVVTLDVEPVPDLPVYVAPTISGVSYSVKFQAIEARFQVTNNLKKELHGKIDSQSLSNWWTDLAQQNHDPLTSQIKNFAQQHAFNDWDKAVLVTLLSEQLFFKNDQRIIWQWYVLNRLGLDVRPAKLGNNLILLFASYQTLVGQPFIRIGGTKYYLKDVSETKNLNISTYDLQRTSSTEPLNLLPSPDLNVGSKWQYRSLNFNFEGSEFNLKLPVNIDRVEYLATYPLLDLKDFMSVDVPTSLKDALRTSLGPELSNQTDEKALSLLLRFAQTAFDYKTDQEQFGKEKYLLAEEVLFYPYSDCEDRSQFLTAVIDSLSPRPLLALQFPNHLAIAAETQGSPKGYGPVYSGKKYILLDSTYKNASPGQLMPHLKNTKPKIMVIQ